MRPLRLGDRIPRHPLPGPGSRAAGKPDFSIRGKHRDPLTARSKLLLGATSLFGLLPYAGELLRRHPTLKPLPERR